MDSVVSAWIAGNVVSKVSKLIRLNRLNDRLNDRLNRVGPTD